MSTWATRVGLYHQTYRFLTTLKTSMVKPIRLSPSERFFWWQVWKFFIPSLHTVTNVTVWRLGMKNSYLSPSENFIPKWWQIWILFIWWHTIWWHIHIDMKMNIFFRWWHVQTVTSMILIGEWYFFFRWWQVHMVTIWNFQTIYQSPYEICM